MLSRNEIVEIFGARRPLGIVGLGRTAIQATTIFHHYHLPLLIFEKQQREEFLARSPHAAALPSLSNDNCTVHFGVDGEKVAELADGLAFVLLSPGVPAESATAGALRRRGVRTIGELDLASALSAGKRIVVGGSNGKSTTVHLIGSMLAAQGFSVRVAADPRRPLLAPFVDDLAKLLEDRLHFFTVFDASTYQLESSSYLDPEVALLLNLHETQLERYGTLERYAAINAKIFEGQRQDSLAIVNRDDPASVKLCERVRAKVQYFSSESVDCAASVSADQLAIRLSEQGVREDYSLTNFKLLGAHNLVNLAAAALAARSCGVERPAIQSTIESFQGLPHRIELCTTLAERGGPLVVNDSKATNATAVMAAATACVNRFPGKKLTLLLGGIAKAERWSALSETLSKLGPRVKNVICFGADAGFLAHNIKLAELPFIVAEKLEDAVKTALKGSDRDDLLLFSPGCLSFDQFSDFEERGNVFKSLLSESIGFGR